MKVTIEARALSGSGSGVQTYTRELIRHLLKLAGNEYTVLYSSQQAAGTFEESSERIIPLRHEALLPLWLHRAVPKVLDDLKPDVVHFTKADVPKKKLFPTVVTIYDVIPLLLPQTQAMSRRLYWPRALQRAAHSSDHIMTISETSKADITELLQVDPSKITVTSLAINADHFKPVKDADALARLREKYDLPEKYVLFVGTRDIRKNIRALIKAYATIHDDVPHHLVIAGKNALKQDDSSEIAARLSLQEKVHVLGTVSYEDLPALYSGADLFVWPSVYEGWGFPPQEAMACGTPVVVSNGGPLPEVVGHAGEIVEFSEHEVERRLHDEAFISSLGERMSEVLGNSNKREQMAEAGLQRVREFSWAAVAETTMRVYEEVNRNL